MLPGASGRPTIPARAGLMPTVTTESARSKPARARRRNRNGTRREGGIGAGGLAVPLLVDPIGQIVAAMIGGQHHDIVDIVAVQAGEEFAEDAIEGEHLNAHLAAAGAEAVADIIGGRKADGE